VAHSTYLDFIYQLGIVGTALYWTTVFQLVKKILRSIKRCPMNYCICIIIAVMYFFLSELLCSDLPFHLALIFMVYNEKIADPHQKHKIYVIKNTKPF
jgi:O-antigen ligase